MYLFLWNSETISSFFIFILFSYSFYNSKIKRKEEYIYMFFFYLLSEKAEDIFIWHAYINE
jgi:hypothetical protein